ncbi:hypothetical protein GGS21DRAFT_64354 [Xylaria nigripes]|nr:hypothetical protein GGS21DRAFT_64354 [Xylaria nigripes]
MTDRTPGDEQAVEDLQCYNCGMKGHMVFACPEDTRRVPAGLEASRKRQASENGYHTPVKRTKGAVVTHYPPPPSGLPLIPPRPTSYSPRPGYEAFHSRPTSDSPVGSLYHKPHPGHYEHHRSPNGERSVSRGFPHGSSRDAYEYHFQGSPQVHSPDAPFGAPLPDQYDQYRSGSLTVPPYGHPYSARPASYNENYIGLRPSSNYPITHLTSHQMAYEQHPPNSSIDNHYAGPPQPYPMSQSSSYPNAYGYDGTFPAHSYPHRPPALRTYPYRHPPSDPSPYHNRWDDRFAHRPSYEPQRDSQHHSERRSNEGWRNRERRDRRIRYDSTRGRSRSERRFQDRPARLPSPVNTTPPIPPRKDEIVPEGSSPQRDNNAVPVDIKIKEQYTEDFSWEEEMIFKELPVKITRDLIWEPLPVEWTGEPIMPPKYDKETITSKYVTLTNVDEFALSVRKTKAWQVMQYHPVFLPPREVRIEKLWDYERALNPSLAHSKYSRRNSDSHSSSGQYGKILGPKAQGGNQSWKVHHHEKVSSSSDDRVNYFQSVTKKRGWNQIGHLDPEESQMESEVAEKRQRVSSPEPGEVCETDDQELSFTTKSTSPPWDEESPQARQNRQDRLTQDIMTKHNAHHSSPQSPSSPTHPPDQFSSSLSRPSSRRSSPGSPSRLSSRRSTRSNPSRSSSRRSSIGSPLTPNERELLGMRPYSSSSDTGRDSPIPQLNGASVRPRQRPTKVHAAYQRRW